MNYFKILTFLLLVSFALGVELNFTNTASASKYFQVVIKEPTADPSKKIRLDLAFSSETEIARFKAFYALCGTHDVGGSLTDNDNHPGFNILLLCTYGPSCTPSGYSHNNIIRPSKYLKPKKVFGLINK